MPKKPKRLFTLRKIKSPKDSSKTRSTYVLLRCELKKFQNLYPSKNGKKFHYPKYFHLVTTELVGEREIKKLHSQIQIMGASLHTLVVAKVSDPKKIKFY